MAIILWQTKSASRRLILSLIILSLLQRVIENKEYSYCTVDGKNPFRFFFKYVYKKKPHRNYEIDVIDFMKLI